MENSRFVSVATLPDAWASILSDTVFELRQGPTFVADFTNAWTINTVLSEIRILLNHVANEISSLQDQISKADKTVPDVVFQSAVQYSQQQLVWQARTKTDLESDLNAVKLADILSILPERWVSEVKQKYSEIEHSHKPEFHAITEEEIISRAVETGLMPRLYTT